MMEGLRDIIGVLMMLGLILLLKRTLDFLFLRKPPKPIRRVSSKPPKSPAG
jgi:hypothetical protein